MGKIVIALKSHSFSKKYLRDIEPYILNFINELTIIKLKIRKFNLFNTSPEVENKRGILLQKIDST